MKVEMPIYEYLCEDCGSRFEKLVRNGAGSDSLACPSCGQKQVSQQLSVFAAHSAGSSAKSAAPMGGGCPAGMCRTPDICGRN